MNKIAIERQDNIPKNVISYNKLRNNARLMEWCDILSIRDTNSAIDALISKIKDYLNNATVSKTREKSDRNRIPRKNWITPAIIIFCNRKEILYSFWEKNPNCEVLRHEYKNYSKVLDKVIKDAKIKFEKDRIAASNRDPKKLWEIINSKLGKVRNPKSRLNIYIETIQK